MKIDLFIELIRLAIGTCPFLSHAPEEEEWIDAYEQAKKHALIGICAHGLKKAHAQAPTSIARLPVDLMTEWMFIGASIKNRNVLMNDRCAELYAMIKSSGYDSCVLKGQTVARLYADDKDNTADTFTELGFLRQPGDIDIWMLAKDNVVIEWARKTQSMYYYDYHHADLSLFKDAGIELHYRPSISRNLIRNARLQKWFQREGKKHIAYDTQLRCNVPDAVFGLILTLNHNLWHLLYEGVGLRQMMDLYFVAHTMQGSEETERLLKHFSLRSFAAASAWVLWHLFDGCKSDSLFVSSHSPLPPVNEFSGQFLLNEIMQAGNFGKYDNRNKWSKSGSRVILMLKWMKHIFRLTRQYPIEVMWTPLGILRISLWRRVRYIKEKELKQI